MYNQILNFLLVKFLLFEVVVILLKHGDNGRVFLFIFVVVVVVEFTLYDGYAYFPFYFLDKKIKQQINFKKYIFFVFFKLFFYFIVLESGKRKIINCNI